MHEEAEKLLLCRICGAPAARQKGDLNYYQGFNCSVYDCASCGCRFTRHNAATYQALHSQPNSSYATYRELAATCRRMFGRRDLAGLKRALCETRKFKFVIDSIEGGKHSAKLLELGCSRGYLTSYFILGGWQIVGSDISPEAVRGAIAAFGSHFVTTDSQTIQDRAPYDVIYHVGTIGCVADPIAFTRNLLELLNPGGRLLFNAPNLDNCRLPGQLWIDAAPPPDVTTLFPAGFWNRSFADVAEVSEKTEMLPPEQSVALWLRKLSGRRWREPSPRPIEDSLNDFRGARAAEAAGAGKCWSLLERLVGPVARMSEAAIWSPVWPSPFGQFVTMTRKAA